MLVFKTMETLFRFLSPPPLSQCILTRSDYDVFFFGESVALDSPQAFTCPLCGAHGFTEATLRSHVAAEHAGSLLSSVFTFAGPLFFFLHFFVCFCFLFLFLFYVHLLYSCFPSYLVSD